MPLYEFVCIDCGTSTDVFASLAQKEAGIEVHCQDCGSAHMRRALSTVSVRGRATTTALAPSAAPAAGGGCCGGGCCG